MRVTRKEGMRRFEAESQPREESNSEEAPETSSGSSQSKSRLEAE